MSETNLLNAYELCVTHQIKTWFNGKSLQKQTKTRHQDNITSRFQKQTKMCLQTKKNKEIFFRTNYVDKQTVTSIQENVMKFLQEQHTERQKINKFVSPNRPKTCSQKNQMSLGKT